MVTIVQAGGLDREHATSLWRAAKSSASGMDNRAAVEALSALGFETRLEALQILAKCGADGLSAGDLAFSLGVPQNTLSGHIQCLARANLVTGERRSRSIIYRINTSSIRSLVTLLNSTTLDEH